MSVLKLERRELIRETRMEILNGKIYLMAGTSANHNYVFGNILNIFMNFLKGKKCQVFGENMKVIFDEDNKVLPDLKIVCDPSKIKKNAIEGAPDLIVEILSPRTQTRDMTEKKDLYEKHGVKEYWIVDTNWKTIKVYILKDGKYILDNNYTIFDEDDIAEIKRIGDEEEIKRMETTSFKTSVFGDNLIIEIADVFDNIE
ncbi:MAG: Uma2 family endonuclease [Oscillospiraceae bacterium]|nr:Uma2 family endonuclease [Oscillospiraceae bacterium]